MFLKKRNFVYVALDTANKAGQAGDTIIYPSIHQVVLFAYFRFEVLRFCDIRSDCQIARKM